MVSVLIEISIELNYIQIIFLVEFNQIMKF
jgi:hypothetical protein